MIFIIDPSIKTYNLFFNTGKSKVAFVYDLRQRNGVIASNYDEVISDKNGLVIFDSANDMKYYKFEHGKFSANTIYLSSKVLSRFQKNYIILPYKQNIDSKLLHAEAADMIFNMQTSGSSKDLFKTIVQEKLIQKTHEALDNQNIPLELIECIKSYLLQGYGTESKVGQWNWLEGEFESDCKSMIIEEIRSSVSIIDSRDNLLDVDESNIAEDVVNLNRRLLAKDIPTKDIDLLISTAIAITNLPFSMKVNSAEAISLQHVLIAMQPNGSRGTMADKILDVLLSDYHKTESNTGFNFIKNFLSTLKNLFQYKPSPSDIKQLINTNISSNTIESKENLLFLMKVISVILPVYCIIVKSPINDDITALEKEVNDKTVFKILTAIRYCNDNISDESDDPASPDSGGANPDCLPMGGHSFIEVSE